MIADPGHVFYRHGLSPQHGFLPGYAPLERLPSTYYEPWELIIEDLPHLTEERSVREAIDALPVLDTARLSSEDEWRRAYSVLCFLTHAYIWGGDQPSQKLPPSISRPFHYVSDYFDLPQIATYAGLNLWNFAPKFPSADLTLPENVRSLTTLTGTPDEEWFYVVSISVEAEGAKIIPVMLECFEAVDANDAEMVAHLLETMSRCINQLGAILDRMHERCDPEVFYHKIRPVLAGVKGMQLAGLPQGVFYDQGEGRGSWREYSGGSNAQSSLIQLLDIMLGIEHGATGEGASSKLRSPGAGRKQAYIEEMRRYMPKSHRLFLQHVIDAANIRQYATQPYANPEVQTAYKAAVTSLTTFRDKHIQIVARYIVAPSHRSARRAPEQRGNPINLATVTSTLQQQQTKSNDTHKNEGGGDVQLCGTGGTNLIPFLKQTRDETKRAGQI